MDAALVALQRAADEASLLAAVAALPGAVSKLVSDDGGGTSEDRAQRRQGMVMLRAALVDAAVPKVDGKHTAWTREVARQFGGVLAILGVAGAGPAASHGSTGASFADTSGDAGSGSARADRDGNAAADGGGSGTSGTSGDGEGGAGGGGDSWDALSDDERDAGLDLRSPSIRRYKYQGNLPPWGGRLQVLIVGPDGSGRMSLARRWVDGDFGREFECGVGSEVLHKTQRVSGVDVAFEITVARVAEEGKVEALLKAADVVIVTVDLSCGAYASRESGAKAAGAADVGVGDSGDHRAAKSDIGSAADSDRTTAAAGSRSASAPIGCPVADNGDAGFDFDALWRSECGLAYAAEHARPFVPLLLAGTKLDLVCDDAAEVGSVLAETPCDDMFSDSPVPHSALRLKACAAYHQCLDRARVPFIVTSAKRDVNLLSLFSTAALEYDRAVAVAKQRGSSGGGDASTGGCVVQ